MGLSRTVSEIDCDFSRKSQIFPTPRVFTPPLRVPLGIGYRCKGSKYWYDGATRWSKKFWWVYPFRHNILACDTQTRCDSKDRAMQGVARVKTTHHLRNYGMVGHHPGPGTNQLDFEWPWPKVTRGQKVIIVFRIVSRSKIKCSLFSSMNIF